MLSQILILNNQIGKVLYFITVPNITNISWRLSYSNTEISNQSLMGLTDVEVQLRYESEQNITKHKQTNIYSFLVECRILLNRNYIFFKNTLIQ